MPHTVWNLGSLTASGRHQPRQFVAGIEPAQEVFIGRAREPKNMIVLLDAWIEVNDWQISLTPADSIQTKYSLALGKDPLNTALLLPVGRVSAQILDVGVGATDQPVSGVSPTAEQLFKAQGTMWAAREIAIDVLETGAVAASDVDVHLDWTVAGVDWWTWFIGWNRLEVTPDGSLTDGERAYA